jgi:hypothetical protein
MFATNMESRPRNLILVVIGIAVIVLLAWFGRSFVAAQSIVDLASPQLQTMPLPEDCVAVDETSPASLLRIVEYERDFYHLTLQKVVVCKTPRRLPQSEPDFTNTFFDQETRRRWLPMYVGCCAYEFRRHFAVVVADVNSEGSLVVEAVLVQGRWEHFRHNWYKREAAWSY